MNEQIVITSATRVQPLARNNIHRRDSRPLREALIRASQVKLLLQRAKTQESGFQKSECLNRLLQGLDRICASIEQLCGSGPQDRTALASTEGEVRP